VLALQGAFREHRKALEACGAEVVEIRRPLDDADTEFKGLGMLDGIVLPGGESTTMGKLLCDWDLLEAIQNCGKRCMPIFGTCAGMILLCKEIEDASGNLLTQPRLGLLDARVRRNAFGRQLDSFETTLDVKGVAPDVEAVFIRAPLITSTAPGIEILAELQAGEDCIIVAVRQKNLLAASFHPELTEDLRFHSYFLEMCSMWKRKNIN
jgi:5'-phosphate synthase pdxT subunit